MSADLSIVPIPAFADNYIWALVSNGHCVVVDPGDAAPVASFLADRELILDAILVTHHHADHVGGVDTLLTRWTVPVYGPAGEQVACVTHPLEEGDQVQLPGIIDGALRVMLVPGHTRGHIAYVGNDLVFCGDTLFAAGCGRLFEGTAQQLHHSLSRLAALPPSTRVYCTHEYTLSNLRFALAVDGDNAALVERSFVEQARRERGEPTLPSTIALERATNPFLRCDVDAVVDSAQRHANLSVAERSNAAVVFAALRQWKNDFRG